VVDDWMAATEVTISAVQCWTSIEENLGVVPCTVMSMMSNELLSSACEVDICGVLGMHALQLASGTLGSARLELIIMGRTRTKRSASTAPICLNIFSAGEDGFSADHCRHLGKENTFGTCVGLIKPEKMSFARFSTDDTSGKIGDTWRRAIHRRSPEHLRRRGA